MTSSGAEPAQGREGALRALLQIAADPEVTREYPKVSAVLATEDYEALVALAWRHQFDEDRTKFKRGLHELKASVSQRLLASLEDAK